ncbi:TPA: hypothetical protein RXP52_005355 [Escherichia coli]|nr:hypothetical protein [Escherichia coli]HEA8571020.1 hypothetical protein [Escherichia coli]HEA8664506.1 hypothetical protein [Escherichia coli]HEA8669779.1 hypothetical protein [Escherichia coli]HEA8735892.1 hypothetical protein [Escherichia coli]
MSKKITKTLLSSSLVVGLLSVSSFTRANEYSYSALDVLGKHGSTYTIVIIVILIPLMLNGKKYLAVLRGLKMEILYKDYQKLIKMGL